MAEIVIHIRDDEGPTRKDGDLLLARSDDQAQRVHLQHVLSPKTTPRNSDGLLSIGSLLHAFLMRTCKYRFRRTGRHTVRRTELSSGKNMTFSNNPHPQTGESINVIDFLRRKLSRPNNKIFGTNRNEVWFGGEQVQRASRAKIIETWDDIENSTPIRRNDQKFRRWPFSREERQHFLILATDDFDDDKSEDLAAVEFEEEIVPGVFDIRGNPEKRRIPIQRKHDVPWRDLTLPRTVEEIRDQNVDIEVREFTSFLVDVIKQRKPTV